MFQSEKLMQGVHFTPFRVDVQGLADYEQDFMEKFHQKTDELREAGLVKFNSTASVKEWFFQISGGAIDTSRGTGKDVYLRPDYQEAYPELKLFAQVKAMESLRRHIKTFWKTLEEQEQEQAKAPTLF